MTGRRPSRHVAATIVTDDDRRADVTIDMAESPLAWLACRRDKDGAPLVSPAELAAGERLRLDYTLAGLMGRTTMNWDALGCRAEKSGGHGGGALIADATLDARQRVATTLKALGPDLGGVLVDVCCHLKGIVDIERDHGWPQRSGKVVLRLALAALARHYGLADVASGRSGAPTRQWGTADFKPRGQRPAPSCADDPPST